MSLLSNWNITKRIQTLKLYFKLYFKLHFKHHDYLQKRRRGDLELIFPTAETVKYMKYFPSVKVGGPSGALSVKVGGPPGAFKIAVDGTTIQVLKHHVFKAIIDSCTSYSFHQFYDLLLQQWIKRWVKDPQKGITKLQRLAETKVTHFKHFLLC